MSAHTSTLCDAFDRLEAELKREHTSARVKAAMAVVRSRVDDARHWMSQTGEVQSELFGDTTPKNPIIRAPYSDTGASLDAAAGTIKSGAAKRLRRWILVRLEQGALTSDGLESMLEKVKPGRAWHSSVSARLNGLVGDELAFVDGSRRTRSGRRAGLYHITAKGMEVLGEERATK